MKSYAMMIMMLWSEVFAVVFLLAGIILGTIGASNYIRNRNDERTYRPWKTICIVRNYTSNRCDCQWFSGYCNIDPCFNEEFFVNYEIFNRTMITSSIKSIGQRNLDRKHNDTCYYNGRYNLTSVKWNYADKTLGLILFCIGYGIVAFVTPIIVILLMFLIVKRRHNQRILVCKDIGNSSDILYRLDETLAQNTV